MRSAADSGVKPLTFLTKLTSVKFSSTPGMRVRGSGGVQLRGVQE